MKFKLEIECGNAALDEENRVDEVARMLRVLAYRMEDSGAARVRWANLRDINGNPVGIAAFTDSD